MAFLDSLVSGLIKKGTGYNSRRLVRRVGGKRLVLMGAAALAGALANEHMQKRNTPSGAAAPSPPTGPKPPPNLPPLPVTKSSGAPAEAPPLPALPGAARSVPAAREPEDAQLPTPLLYAITRTMIAGALADGRLSDEEREIIQSQLSDAPFTPVQTAQIHRDLVVPSSVDELAAMADTTEDRELILRFAVLVVGKDDEVVARELEWLEQLAKALRVDEVRLKEIEAEFEADQG